MHCAIAIRHPEHTRFFTPIYHHLVDDGHEVSVFVRENGHATELLELAGVDYDVLVGPSASRRDLILGHAAFEWRLLRAARKRNVDVLTAIGGLAVEHVAPLAGARSVVFVDWERGGVSDTSVRALADVVCKPRFVESSFGPQTVTYAGYHELAYLHPHRYHPTTATLPDAGIETDSDYIVVSFVDDGRLTDEAMARITRALVQRAPVYLSHESRLPTGFEELPRLPWSVTDDALAFASLYVGNATTMATEAALLGTPSVILRGDEQNPRCDELEARYELVVRAPIDGSDLSPIEALADDFEEATAQWRKRRDGLLLDTVDVLTVATDCIVEGNCELVATESNPVHSPTDPGTPQP